MTHQPILESRSIAWITESDCAAFAESLAEKPGLKDAFIALEGPLGAGKTTFARHLLRALGAKGRIKSPTYALLEPYDLPGLHASHLDFYRFADPREWVDAGLREVFEQPGLKLVEWPDKAGALLPAADLRLCISPRDDGARDVVVHAQTPRGVELLA
ncbi:MAG TPA: tRNA (adenosine(37)-N6)-threonylcarbamoyltransferase complex ATPase subunit type 1 TsaE [Burkholderiaceae bacterium]|nr:tRNA (adenosine(37)-N6)-threonylcarbamoyltransferase complex ATPase subunit type 1 TsaE [Burkholderiaceae bacterium]